MRKTTPGNRTKNSSDKTDESANEAKGSVSSAPASSAYPFSPDREAKDQPAGKRGKSALARLTDWLENGDEALQLEMEATLEDEENAFDPGQTGRDATENPVKKAENIPDSNKNTTKDGKSLSDRLRGFFYRPRSRWISVIVAVGVCAVLIALLMYAVSKMPRYGGADTLVDSEVSTFYVENTLEETGAVNIVTGIILDYRGFDTLGESHVLFIAVCAVLLMLSVKGEKDEKKRLARAAYEQYFEPHDDLILQGAARILSPLVMVFGLYIILNGHLSPGGGFSGGAVLGAGLILYQNAFGYRQIKKFFTYRTFRFVSVFSLLGYSLMKGYHFFMGANHLDSGLTAGHVGNIFSAGLLLPLNAVVGAVVACTMYALYTMFRKGEF